MLKDTLQLKQPSLVFLSESQIFQSDIDAAMVHVQGEYCYYLNSDDSHDPELPLVKNHSLGGTLLLWAKSLDPYITVHPVSTCSFSPLILKLPGFQSSIHVALYLPTHGKDSEFVSELADLKICLEELTDLYPDSVIFIRGCQCQC